MAPDPSSLSGLTGAGVIGLLVGAIIWMAKAWLDLWRDYKALMENAHQRDIAYIKEIGMSAQKVEILSMEIRELRAEVATGSVSPNPRLLQHNERG